MRTVTLDRPDGTVVTLCPTARSNLEHLLIQYKAVGGTPTGAITKHYGRLIRLLAKEIYFELKGETV